MNPIVCCDWCILAARKNGSLGHIINPLLTKREVNWLNVGLVFFCVFIDLYPGCQRLFWCRFRFLSSLDSEPREIPAAARDRSFGLRPKMCRTLANIQAS